METIIATPASPDAQDSGAPARRGFAWPPPHGRSGSITGALLLVTPLVVFLRYQSYGLLQPESVLALVLLAIVGAALGFLFEAFGGWSRAVLIAFLVTLTVDIQSQTPDRLRLLWITFIVTLVTSLSLRHILPRVLPVILAGIFLVSCFAPVQRDDVGLRDGLVAAPGDPELPVVVHLILDEQIGVEGIPEEFDAQGHYAFLVRDLFLKHDFRVFGRSFSRFYNTFNAIPNLLNFDVPAGTREYVRQSSTNWAVTENAYFAHMSEMGYAIRIIQSKYLDYADAVDETINIEWLWTFDSERLTAIQGTPLSVGRRMVFILGMYTRLSSIASRMHLPVRQVTPVATLPVLDKLRDEVVQAERGTLFFAHLLLPHGPYGLTETCDVRPDPENWLQGYDKRMAPRRNNPGTRMMRYPLYLQQMECLMRRLDDFFTELLQSPHAEDMIIVVHGDHGSRLDCGPPKQRFVRKLDPQDYVDGFSTLFAVRRPGIAAGYDRRMVAVDQLFTTSMRDALIPDGEDWIEEPEVMFEQRAIFKSYPMPSFERDLEALRPSEPREDLD